MSIFIIMSINLWTWTQMEKNEIFGNTKLNVMLTLTVFCVNIVHKHYISYLFLGLEQ